MFYIKKHSISVVRLLSVLVFILLMIGLALFAPGKENASDVSSQNDGTPLTLIIDPGHGGADGGAVSLTGVYESEINMAIAEKLDQIMGLYGVNVVMTRTSENIDYPDDANTIGEKKVADQRNRLQMINETERAVLISIHQNNFTSSQPFGAQVLYAETDGSLNFADYMQQILIDSLNPENYRTATEIPDSIFLMNNISCPAVLIECGFLSNESENALLQTNSYQLKVAATITAGYLNSVEMLNDTYMGGTNEG